MSSSNLCQCLTAAKAPCKRPAEKGSNKCWQHKNNCVPLTELGGGTLRPISVSKPAPVSKPISKPAPGSRVTGFGSMPADISRKIAANLTVKEILEKCTLDKKFQAEVCNNKLFWEDLAQKHLGYDQTQARTTSIANIKKDLHNLQNPYPLDEGLELFEKFSWQVGDGKLNDIRLIPEGKIGEIEDYNEWKSANDPEIYRQLTRKINFGAPWELAVPDYRDPEAVEDFAIAVFYKMPALVSPLEIFQKVNEHFENQLQEIRRTEPDITLQNLLANSIFVGLTKPLKGRGPYFANLE